MAEQVLLGGMAMPDGVFIKSTRAWAAARADGTVETGEVKRSPVAKIPVVRIAWAIAQGFGSGFLRRRRSGTAGRSRLRRALLALIVAGVLGSLWGWAFPEAPFWISAYVVAVITLGVVRLLMPPQLWRYHGAEHKAIATHEHGLPLTVEAARPVSRIHDRCGTNAVFLGLLASPLLVQGYLVLLAVLVAAEVLRYMATKHARSPITRLLVGGGRALQRVTTAEPTDEELATGLRAVRACLDAHAELVSR